MELKRLVALAMSIALAIASHQSIRLDAQAAEPVVPSQVAVQARALGISGTVLRSDRKTPVANQCLRLRKMDSNAIAARSVSEQNGMFSFSVSEPGMYVVEVVECGDGGVRAVSDALALGALPLTTVVVLPTALSASLLSSTALLVLATAATAGITAAAIAGGQGDDSGGVLSPEQ